MKIWIDADACPKMVKEMIFKASARVQVPVVLVANSRMYVPSSPLVSLIVVAQGFGVADNYLLGKCEVGDLVITADIPLAHSLVEKGILAINPRGDVYTEDNVGEVLAMRNLMSELRSGGQVQGGPPALGLKDKAKFAQSFDKALTRLLKERP